MRFVTISALLLATVAAVPAAAQDDVLGSRVGKLEKEMRAVQRKVFPGAPASFIDPEIQPPVAATPLAGTPATSSINDLTARVDSLERQLATLTGQAEHNGYKLRQIEEAMAKLRADYDYRLATIENAGGAATVPPPPAPIRRPAAQPAPRDPAPVRSPAQPVPRDPAPAPAPSIPIDAAPADAGETAYLAGYDLWMAKRYGEAQAALKDVVAKYPSHKRASYAQNLLGRAYLDEGKPALAAEAFYSNYRKMPRGERAPDSLYYLGSALVALKKPAEACRVYDELTDVYGERIAQTLKDKVAQARATAKCGA